MVGEREGSLTRTSYDVQRGGSPTVVSGSALIPGSGPLAGFAVAVATDRRRHQLGDELESLGAKTLGIQAVRPLATPDADLVTALTQTALSGPIDEFVVSSAFGLRAWLRVARSAGLYQDTIE